MKYRSRTEITAQIIESANESITKTKIMYKAFLSYAQLKEYLHMLLENGLLEYNSEEQTYKATPKGFKFLQIHGRLGEFVTAVGAEAAATAPWSVKRVRSSVMGSSI
jgi:predicted transcriptional regulator